MAFIFAQRHDSHLPSSTGDFCRFRVHPLQPLCAWTGIHEITEDLLCAFCRQERVVDRETDLRTPGQCHVQLSFGLLLFIFCWTYIKNWVNPVFWWRLTLPGTVTLELDGGGPIRCCMANGCGSFVKCLQISQGPWTHRRKYTFNTLRRFLPTAANAHGFDDKIAQAVGSWQDVSQVECTSSRSIKVMSLHCSDEQAVSSGAAKKQAWTFL